MPDSTDTRKVVSPEGLDAYKGYEYQIDVTVWLALSWMVARKFCAAVEVEPASSEDIEAELNVPAERAKVRVSANIAGDRRVIVQVKSKGTGPWSAKEFREVIAPSKASKASSGATSRGPKPRARALEQLAADTSAIYCFITNAQVDSSLSEFIVDEPGKLCESQKMPPNLRTGEWRGKGEDFTRRITICDQKTADLIDLDTRRILREFLQVPSPAGEAASLSHLKEQVRNRLLGKIAGTWSLASIQDIARQHGGYPEKGKDLESFVPPNNFSRLVDKLEQEHKLILIGPAGTGKTLAAEELVFQHRTRKCPFAEIRSPLHPSEIRARFRQPGPVIVYLEDPWGKYTKSPEVDLWVSELPKLLELTGPEKRIVVSSRRAILNEAMEERVKTVRTHMMEIRPEHYGPTERHRILRGALDRAAPWQKDFVDRYKKRVLRVLSVPQSIRVFAAQLCKISVEKQARLDGLLKEAATDAISATFAKEVRGLNWSPGSAKGGAIALWALLSMQGGVTDQRVAQVERKLRRAIPHYPPELRRFVAWGEEAQWLGRRDQKIQAHPTVLEGMESLIEREKALAEDIVEPLITMVTEDGNYSNAERLLLQFSQRELPVPEVVLDAITKWLRRRVLDSSDATVSELMTRFARIVPGTSDPVGMLCVAFEGAIEGPRDFGYRSLPKWDKTQRELVASSEEARELCRRYLLHGVPDDITRGFDIPELLDLIRQLGWDFSSDFVAALEDEDTDIAREHLIRGGAECPLMPWDGVLDRLFVLYDDVDASVATREEQYRAADQAEWDAAYCSHLDEEPQEEFFQVTKAIEVYIDERRRRQGFEWLVQHPRLDALVYRWKKALERAPAPSPDELEGLLLACSDSSREPVWRVIAELSLPEFRAQALDALRSAEPGLLPAVLSAVEQLISPDDFAGWLRGSGHIIGFVRRALLFAAFVGDRDLRMDSQHYVEVKRAVECLDGSAALRAVESCNTIEEQYDVPLEADVELIQYLELLAQSDSLDLSCRALCVLSTRLNRTVVDLAIRCLDMGTDRIRSNVWHAIGCDSSEAARQLVFRRGLSDPDYRCRRIAMRFLAPMASADERAAIIAGADDRSAPIREFVAQSIGHFRWREGLAVLEGLLRDDRNKSESASFGDENHHVARTAAMAFGRFEYLSEDTLERLVKFILSAGKGNRDIVVHYELIKSLGSHDHDSVNALLYKGLSSRRYMQGHKQAGYPLRYAAAWALVDQFEMFPDRRNTANLRALRKAALHDDERLVAPALIALGFVGAYRTQTLDSILTDLSVSVERKELVWLAAIVANDDRKLYENISGFELEFDRLDALSRFHELVVNKADWSERKIESYRSTSAPLDAWLNQLEEDGSEFCLHRRFLLRVATDEHLFSDIDYQALRSQDLATPFPLVTLRSMFGGE